MSRRVKIWIGVALFLALIVLFGVLFHGHQNNVYQPQNEFKLDDWITIKLGSLDDPSRYAPSGHIWTSSAQPWHHIDTNAPIVFAKNFGSAPN